MERDPRKRYQSATVMNAEIDDPAVVQLSNRCDRLQDPSLAKRGLKKALWLALGISIPLIIF